MKVKDIILKYTPYILSNSGDKEDFNSCIYEIERFSWNNIEDPFSYVKKIVKKVKWKNMEKARRENSSLEYFFNTIYKKINYLLEYYPYFSKIDYSILECMYNDYNEERISNKLNITIETIQKHYRAIMLLIREMWSLR